MLSLGYNKRISSLKILHEINPLTRAIKIFFYCFWLTSFFPSKAENLATGHTYFKQKKYASARDCYLKAVMTNPLQGECLLYLGHAYIALRSYKKAEYCLLRSLEFISNPDFSMDLKTLFSTEEELNFVQKQLQKAFQTQPESLQLRTLLSYVYFFSGERESAKLLFHELLQRSKEDRFARFFIERINREEEKLLLQKGDIALQAMKSSSKMESCKPSETLLKSPEEATNKTTETESFSKENPKNTFSH